MRDLKPANIMLTKGGSAQSGALQAKLLDFGLARLTHDACAPGGATLTDATVPKGTAPYMAPEQIEGRETDARTDLFAFGAVLYEMLTGTRAFAGTSPASTMAAILEHEPRAASSLQPAIPPAIDRLITRCLAKDPDARWQSAADLADELRWIRETSGGGAAAVAGVQSRQRPGLRLARVVAGALALFAAGATLMWFIRPASTPKTDAGQSLDLSPAAIGPFASSYTPGGSRTAFAWSGNGRTLVFSGHRGDVDRLYVRDIDKAVAQPLEGTDGALQPVVSPDGRWVAFWAQRKVRKIPFGGGPVVDLASDLANPAGMAWDGAGKLFIGKYEDNRIWTIAADGALRAVTTLEDGEVAHVLPSLLPSGGALLYTVRRRYWSWGDEQVVAQTLATGRRKRLLTDAADARYLPSGHLVFLRQGRLFAVAFDEARIEPRGTPEIMLDSVAQALTARDSRAVTGAGQFAVAATGGLAWIRSPVVEYPDAALATVDRRGAVTRLPAPARPYPGPLRLSPDGLRLAVPVQTLSTGGVWIYDLERTTMTPIWTGGEVLWVRWWGKDGRRILIDRREDGHGAFAWMPSDGSSQPRVWMPSGGLYPSSFTPDGRQLAIVRDLGTPGDEVALLTVEDGQARVETLIPAAEKPGYPEISPNGRWLAYRSSKSGRGEIYVLPFPGPGAAGQVSVDGGSAPAWNPNGGELFFLSTPDTDGRVFMMAVEFSPGTPPRIGRPERLFEFDREKLAFGSNPVRSYDVAPDGQQFYAVQRLAGIAVAPVTHINYIPNWLQELKAKVPTR